MSPEADIVARGLQLLERCKQLAAIEAGAEALLTERGHILRSYADLRKLARTNGDAARLLWEFPLALGLWATSVFPNELIRWNKLGERAARAIRDRAEAGEVLICLNCNLASQYAHRGRLVKAAASLRIACWIAGDLGRTLWQGRLMGDLGEVLMQTGDLTEAELWMKDSLAISRTLADAEGETLAWFRLAQWQRLTGDYAGAVSLIEALLPQVRANGPSGIEWKALAELGIVYREQGNFQAAHRLLEQALAVAGKDLIAQERVYQGLGIIALRSGDTKLAQEYLGRAVQTNRASGQDKRRSEIPTYGMEDMLTTASLQMGLGAAEFALGDAEYALDQFRSALDSFRKGGDPVGECEALYNIALAQFRLCQFGQAMGQAQAAVDSTRALGHPLRKQAEILLEQIRLAAGSAG